MVSRIPEMIDAGCRTVALTGAGVSAESGVPTFRGAGGLWEGHRAEELATPEAFARDPERVWAWYDWRRGIISSCRPNPAHEALAQMETRLTDFHLVTQNVDGVHRLAGSRNLLELHGCLWLARCTREGTVREDRRVPLPELPPRCECGAILRPHVVWFGEQLDADILGRATELSARAELFLVVGTSGVVQPAAGLAQLARHAGGYVVEVNPEETPLTALADEHHRGPAGEILPELFRAEAGGR
jgi:NAD-dependent deacetylase